MQGGNFMANNYNGEPFDPTQPLTFELPDGNTVNLITWEYVMKKLEEELSATLSYLSDNNTQLKQIEDRIDEWLAEQNPE